METVGKKKSDGQGAQSFRIEFGAGDDHRDSPEGRLKARETAFEPPSSSVLGRPVARTGGRWLLEEKGKAERKESMMYSDVEANKNQIKQTKMQAQHSSPPCSSPPKEFQTRPTMEPKQPKDPEALTENVWTEKGKKLKRTIR